MFEWHLCKFNTEITSIQTLSFHSVRTLRFNAFELNSRSHELEHWLGFPRGRILLSYGLAGGLGIHTLVSNSASSILTSFIFMRAFLYPSVPMCSLECSDSFAGVSVCLYLLLIEILHPYTCTSLLKHLAMFALKQHCASSEKLIATLTLSCFPLLKDFFKVFP